MSFSSLEQMKEAEGAGSGVKGESPRSLTAELWDWIKSILLALVIVLIVHQFIFNLSTVRGQSMQPTLMEGEWLFINKLTYYLDTPDRGEVVILKDPSHELKKREFLVKRLIGIPGDLIEVRSGSLYVNGKAQKEPYTDVQIEDGDFGPMEVPDDHYFVMGDNRHRNDSKDSRIFGAVPAEMIKGRAEFILWPITKIDGL